MSAKILVADEKPANFEAIARYFDGLGHALFFFADGQSAWNALCQQDNAFDLAIIDRTLPGLDGLSLLKRIKAESRLAGLPVIIQTAVDSNEDLRAGLEAGAYCYLPKPHACEALLSIARAALSDAAGRTRLLNNLREHIDALLLLQDGNFALRTIGEAQRLATFLAQTCVNPETVALGLSELLINAIEHGNLGISYAEKSELKRQDCWQEEVERRNALPENLDKRVRVHFRREADHSLIRIEDEGSGFAWSDYMDFSPERAFDPNGRGIALARLSSFDSLEYSNGGNTVEVSITRTPNTPSSR